MRRAIMLSAGGTGGHLFPAEALGARLIEKGHHVIIVTDKRGQAFKSLSAPVHIVQAATLKPGIFSKIKAVMAMGMGILQAGFLILKYKPDVIVGFGGYPSFPAVFAGQLLRRRTIVHEQNAILGKANRFLASCADVIAASWEKTRGIKDKLQNKIIVTGNPVRSSILKLRQKEYVPKETLTILVTGGSQGAQILSKVVPEAITLLEDDLQRRITVFHQARAEDLAQVKKTYAATRVHAQVASFFNDMPDKLDACSLFIGRSGASTVAEIAAIGRAAIFIPLEHRDKQQHHNAESLVAAAAAWMILQPDFNAITLAEKLRHFLKNPDILTAAAQQAKKTGQEDATEKLAAAVLKGI